MKERIDAIVNEVLYRIGHTTPMHQVVQLDYKDEDIHFFNPNYYLLPLENFNDIDEITHLLIPELNCSQMMQVASGLPSEPLTKWAVQALLLGKKVHVRRQVVEILNLKEQKTPLFTQHLESLKFLKESGLVIHSQSTLEVKSVFNDLNLVNEKQVNQWIHDEVKEVFIGPKALVTPAALDLMRDYQIKCQKEKL